jgi:hypothetical protein
MTAMPLVRYLLAVGLILTVSQPVLAQTVAEELEAAEQAYAEVDFAAVQRLGSSAIVHGEAEPADLARLHVLLGIAGAAMEQKPDEVRKHFVAALALQPDLRLEHTLSPKLRDPYLEAVAFWGTHSERLRLAVNIRAEPVQLSLTLVDPAKLVSYFRIHTRAPHSAEFKSQRFPAGTQVIPLSAKAAHGFEYAVTAEDVFGNTLTMVGTRAAPIAVMERKHESDSLPSKPLPEATPEKLEPRRNYWVPGLLGVAGLGAAGAGGYFHYRREELARQWNGPGCEQFGSTRGEQCAQVDQDRQRAQWLTAGLYAGAGALIIAGTLVLFTYGASHEESSTLSSLVCGAGYLSIACAGRF